MKFLTFLLLIAAILNAQELTKTYDCPKATGLLTIDGKLDDPAWQSAPWTDYFIDIEGLSKTTPRFHTRAKILWDDQYFYIAAELEEPHVWATLTKHDSVISTTMISKSSSTQTETRSNTTSSRSTL